jgi:hypothetical protein
MRTQFICVALAIVLRCPYATGQWVRTNAPDSVQVDALVGTGTNLFAGTENRGIFLSTNNGTTWTVANTGLTKDQYGYYPVIRGLAVIGTNLYGGGIVIARSFYPRIGVQIGRV